MVSLTRSQRTKLHSLLTKAIKRRQTKLEHRRRARPTDPSGRYYPVVKLDNGLVSIEDIPEYLVTTYVCGPTSKLLY
jgi:hypothetical protein